MQGPTNLKLAQKFYQARVVELRQLIAAEEANFRYFTLYATRSTADLESSRIVASEIEAIRSGAWDDKISERLGLDPVIEETKPVSPVIEDVVCPNVVSFLTFLIPDPGSQGHGTSRRR